ncbi:GNAT family N-acetyltransferase [Silvimonas soli]|uniref:GNAT family N-acetyltransferase n=1 Tax=Silvimonas soli TaxID=2980100 RepID=UPI0024B362D6|nr:GNAT family protein [Silvimonas soli]
MYIRRLLPADAHAYRALRLAALADSPTSFMPTVEEELTTLTPTELERRLAPDGPNQVLGAFDNDALVGIVGLLHDQRRKLAHKMLVVGVFVAAAARGQGYAKALMQEAIRTARETTGVRQLLLNVRTDNLPAKALYTHLGFVAYGCEPDAILVNGQFYDEEMAILRL